MTRILPLIALLACALFASTADARSRDRDHDGLPDRFERLAKTSVKSADSDHDGRRDGAEDADRDSLDNATEFRLGSHPRKRDSDGDGVRDDHEVVGTVKSLTGDVLIITLADNSELKGRITDDTEVECDGTPPAPTAKASDDDDDDAHSGSGHGGGDDGPNHDVNDDHGDDDGPNHDVNDDHGDDDGPNHDDEHGDDDDRDSEDCAAGALKAGAKVLEVDIRGSSTGIVFDEIELAA